MVRLMLTLTPVVCMLGGIALNVTFDHFLSSDDEVVEAAPVAKPAAKGTVVKMAYPGYAEIFKNFDILKRNL